MLQHRSLQSNAGEGGVACGGGLPAVGSGGGQREALGGAVRSHLGPHPATRRRSGARLVQVQTGPGPGTSLDKVSFPRAGGFTLGRARRSADTVRYHMRDVELSQHA